MAKSLPEWLESNERFFFQSESYYITKNNQHQVSGLDIPGWHRNSIRGVGDYQHCAGRTCRYQLLGRRPGFDKYGAFVLSAFLRCCTRRILCVIMEGLLLHLNRICNWQNHDTQQSFESSLLLVVLVFCAPYSLRYQMVWSLEVRHPRVKWLVP